MSMPPEGTDSTAARLASVERELRCYRCGLVLILLAISLPHLARTAGPARASAQEAGATPAPAKAASEIYEELHQRSHRALTLIDESLKIGAPNPGTAGEVALWSLRLLETDLYRIAVKSGGPLTTNPEVYLASAVGPADPDRLKAFREHSARMHDWEERFRGLVAKRFITQTEYLAILSRRLEADAWEARERVKPAK